jgi:hypothetical protein
MKAKNKIVENIIKWELFQRKNYLYYFFLIDEQKNIRHAHDIFCKMYS